MTVHVDRLRAELEFVTSRPDLWDQSVWVRPLDIDEGGADREPGADWTCGTAACLAGWAALHADAGLVPDPRYDWVLRAPSGTLVEVESFARVWLGLSYVQGDVLFAAGNSLRDLWEFARVFTAEAIQIPAAVATGPLVFFDPALEDDYRTLGDHYDA